MIFLYCFPFQKKKKQTTFSFIYLFYISTLYFFPSANLGFNMFFFF